MRSTAPELPSPELAPSRDLACRRPSSEECDRRTYEQRIEYSKRRSIPRLPQTESPHAPLGKHPDPRTVAAVRRGDQVRRGTWHNGGRPTHSHPYHALPEISAGLRFFSRATKSCETSLGCVASRVASGTPRLVLHPQAPRYSDGTAPRYEHQSKTYLSAASPCAREETARRAGSTAKRDLCQAWRCSRVSKCRSVRSVRGEIAQSISAWRTAPTEILKTSGSALVPARTRIVPPSHGPQSSLLLPKVSARESVTPHR